MKRILFAVLSLLMAVCLFSCGENGKEAATTTAKADWRNTVEYESAFFVNENLRVLYALDTGSITLWDNGGDGSVMQVIEYDTSVSDAIERIEKEDFNGDENRDIRIVYSESEKGTRYNLFLWSEKSERFVECRLYNSITDPVYDSETGIITGITDKGVFGKVTKQYAFNDTSGLDEVSTVISDVDSVASTLAASVGGGTVEKIVNTVTVDETECMAYTVFRDGKKIAYIAHTPDSVWFVDVGCCGLYRETAEGEEGAVILGDYLGDANKAFSLAKLLKGEEAELIGVTLGVINGADVQRFDAKDNNGTSFAVATDNNGLWYYSENGTAFVQVISSTGEAVGEEEFEFTLPAEE